MPIKEWSKTYPSIPKDNIVSHILLKKPQFRASFELDGCEPSMNLLLSMEYARIWQQEHSDYIKKSKESAKSEINLQKERKKLSESAIQKKKNGLKPKKLKVMCDKEDTIKPEKIKREVKKQELPKQEVGIQKDFCECISPPMKDKNHANLKNRIQVSKGPGRRNSKHELKRSKNFCFFHCKK